MKKDSLLPDPVTTAPLFGVAPPDPTTSGFPISIFCRDADNVGICVTGGVVGICVGFGVGDNVGTGVGGDVGFGVVAT